MARVGSLTLDTGALIAFERADRRVIALVNKTNKGVDHVLVPAAVLAQAWRDGRRQARLSYLLGAIAKVVPLNELEARVAGQLCGLTNTSDVADASVAACAKRFHSTVVTSDPEDIRAIDPSLRIIAL